MIPSVDFDFMTIEEVRKEFGWPPEHNSVIGLVPYLRRLGPNISGLEIGTEKGESAYLMLEECPNISTLYTLDPYVSYQNWNELVPEETQKRNRDLAYKNLERFGDRVQLLHYFSEAVPPDFLSHNSIDFTKSLDFVFLDGAIQKKNVAYDLNFWYDHLRPGGIMAGHNYQLKDVREAVDEFRKVRKITVPLQRTRNYTYFWYKGK